MAGSVSVRTCARVTQIRVVDVNLVKRLRLALFWWPIIDVPAICVNLFVCVCFNHSYLTVLGTGTGAEVIYRYVQPGRGRYGVSGHSEGIYQICIIHTSS